MRACVVAVWLVALGCSFKSGIAQPGDGGTLGSDSHGSDARGSDGRDGSSAPLAYREPITIHGAMLTGTHSDFPVWITLSGSAASALAAHARSDGADIFFTDGTNALDYELQRWDPATPLLQAWVRLPSLAHGTDVTIYVEYGDPALAPGASAKNVFKSSYVAVWHLDDSLVTSAIADAVAMSPGTAVALGTAASHAGELGSGIAFDGTGNSMITFTNPVAADIASVITAWVQQPTTTHTSAVAVLGTGAQDESRFLYSVAGAAGGNGSDVAAGLYTDDWYPGGPNVQSSNGGWTYVAWHYAGSKVNHFYVNGAEIGGSPHNSANTANTTGTAGYLGYAPEGTLAGDYGAMTGFSGVLDEVRIAAGAGLARDAGWFATEYANQSSPSTFYMVGAEQAVP